MSDAPAKLPSHASPAPKPSHGKDDDIIERRTLRDYYIILRERLWVALAPALIIALGLFYYQSKETPMYRATASIRFERTKERPLNNMPEVLDPTIGSDVDLITNLKIINSDTMRNLVIASLTPDEGKELQKPSLKGLPPGTPPPSVSALVPKPAIGSERNSLVVYLSINHQSAEGARLIANRYVDEFIKHLGNTAGGINDLAIKNLTARAEELLKQSKEADQALQDFMSTNALGSSLDASTNVVKDNYSKSAGAVTAVRFEELNASEQLKLVERYLAEKRDLFELGVIANHGTIPDLLKTLKELKRNQEIMAERYLANWPDMIKLVNSIGVVQDQLDTAVKLAIADLRASLDRILANKASLERELTMHEAKLKQLGDLSVPFKKLLDLAGIAHQNYTQVYDRLRQIEILNQITTIPVRKLDEAMLPGTPFTPDFPRITKTVVGVFVLVFVFVAVCLSFLDDRIKSAWDVETFINATLLGIIPDLGSLKDDEKYRLALGDAQGPALEPFLGLYSSVKIHSKLDFPKSLLVTSTVPGEGKTLVSCNLAGSFARHGRRTLLIDCDLRRPMLHRHFNKANETGLIAWYENGALLDDGLLANPWLGITPIGDNLSLISSGGRSKSPTQFLESAAFAQLVDRLKKHFDLVVIDSPPLGAVTDGLLIAERADEVLYVCRFNRAYRKHIRLYIKALRSGKNEILGVVLNGLSPRRIEYYSNYRYYRSYKKYYGAQG